MIKDIFKITLSSFSKKINIAAVGLESNIDKILIDAKKVSEFADVIGDVFCNSDKKNHMLSPFYSAVLAYPGIKNILYDKNLKINLVRLVHSGQEIEIFRPIVMNEKIRIINTVKSISATSAGELLNIESSIFTADGNEHLLRSLTSFLIRSKKKTITEKKNKEPFHAEFEFKLAVPFNQGKRYASVSGDNNPIHLNKIFANAAGLPGTILHGMCTLAMVNSVLVRELCKGDYKNYAGISARFSKYVLPGEVLTIEVGRCDNNFFPFEVKNIDGINVIKNGKLFVK